MKKRFEDALNWWSVLSADKRFAHMKAADKPSVNNKIIDKLYRRFGLLTTDRIELGLRVRTNRSFANVDSGTEGVIVEDYGTGITIAWDKADRPYPKDMTPQQVGAMYAIDPKCPLRDGFDKEDELQYLELI